jgi:hypothetical protein
MEETINNDLIAPHQITPPMKKIRIKEFKNVMKQNTSQKGPRLRPYNLKSPSGTFTMRPQSDNTNI